MVAVSTRQARIRIGTSGWHYRHWAGRFYPHDLKSDAYLGFYARHFATVEINSTFYGLPTRETLAAWCDAAPDGFVFASKASRYITHMKKLKDPVDGITRFFAALDLLGDRMGPVLFQTPPNWRVNTGRLADFLAVLPAGRRVAFEFRDRSWFTPAVFEVLARHGAALCAYDLSGYRSPVRVTADFTYIRLHGPAEPYRGTYDGRTLAGWARRFRRWRARDIDVYCYFDNDERGHAVADASRLAAMVAGA